MIKDITEFQLPHLQTDNLAEEADQEPSENRKVDG